MDFLPVVKRIIRQTGASCPLELVMPQLLGLQMHATIVTRVASKLTCNPSTPEAEAGGQSTRGWPMLHSDSLSQIKQSEIKPLKRLKVL